MSGETKAAGEAVDAGLAFAATLTESWIRAMEGRHLDLSVGLATGEYQWYTVRRGGNQEPIRVVMDDAEAANWIDRITPTIDPSEAVQAADWDRFLPQYTTDDAAAWRVLKMCLNFPVLARISIFEGSRDVKMMLNHPMVTVIGHDDGGDEKASLCRAYLLARRAMGIAAGYGPKASAE